MTPEGFKKHKHLIEQWADGAEIEMECSCCWEPVVEPSWVFHQEYRVKPAPKTVEMWVNVGHHMVMPTLYTNKTAADNRSGATRIACVPVTVTYTEGEGL